MPNLLLILHPRQIPDAMESLDALDIDRAWLVGMHEIELASCIPRLIESTYYDNYLLASDDLLIDPEALEEVEALLRQFPVVTGYCNMTYFDPRVNLSHPDTLEPFTLSEVLRQERVFRSGRFGWSLTGMRREVWLEHPFQCDLGRSISVRGVEVEVGLASDQKTSAVLREAGVPILAARDAWCEHLNGKPGYDTRVEIGRVKPHVLVDSAHDRLWT